jgi:hypothetical protein
VVQTFAIVKGVHVQTLVWICISICYAFPPTLFKAKTAGLTHSTPLSPLRIFSSTTSAKADDAFWNGRNLKKHIIVELANMSIFSSNIFPSTPYFFEEMCVDVVCSSFWQ